MPLIALFEHKDGPVIWRESDGIHYVDLHSRASEFAASINTGDERVWERWARMSDGIMQKALKAFYAWEMDQCPA